MAPRPATPAFVRAVDAGLFRALSAVRRKRIVHPIGVAYRAELSITAEALPPATILRQGSVHDAIVRFSRGGGLPDALPDVLGLAIKLPGVYGQGADQDFLLVTSGNGPLVNHLLVPARSFFGLPFSSVLGYRADGERVLFGALPGSRPAPGGAAGLEELVAAAEAGGLRYRFAVASRLGRWRPAGFIEVGARLSDGEAETLRFNPWNTGEDLRPDGFLNWLRDAAYRGSQSGRSS